MVLGSRRNGCKLFVRCAPGSRNRFARLTPNPGTGRNLPIQSRTQSRFFYPIAHSGDEIGLGRLGYEMEMIAHETKGVELPAGLFAGFVERGEEAAIPVIAEDGFAAVTAIHEMDRGRRGIGCARTRHDAGEILSPRCHCQLLALASFLFLSTAFQLRCGHSLFQKPAFCVPGKTPTPAPGAVWKYPEESIDELPIAC
jgi:hypothetical protein